MKLKQLTLASMISAILFVVLWLDTRFAYVISQYFGFIFSLVILLIGVFEEEKTAWMICIVVLILLLITGQLPALIFSYPMVVIGMLMAILMNRVKDGGRLITLIGMVNGFVLLFQYYLLTYVLKIDLDIIEETTALFKQFNLSTQHLILFAYVILFAYCVILIFEILFLFKICAKRLYHQNISYLDLSFFKLNKTIGIISICLVLFYLNIHLFQAHFIIENLTILIVAFLIVLNVVNGAILIYYYLKKQHHARWGVVIPLLCMIPGVVNMILCLGIADAIFNLRRRII